MSKKEVTTAFKALGIYTDNKKYFDQKYYSNWVHSFFYDRKDNLRPHLSLNETMVKEFNHSLSASEEVFEDCYVKGIDIFFFESDLAIFSIKIDLQHPKVQLQNVVDFASLFRRSTINEEMKDIPISVALIEKYITSKFHTNPQLWRDFNPQLKSAAFMDVSENPGSKDINELLYQLGTFSTFSSEDGMYIPEEDYTDKLLDKGLLSIFKNWRVLCLYDSLSRVAINLNEKDKYKLWENEYILIYIYTLYTRYFLHYSNNQLTRVIDNKKLVGNSRSAFFDFKNEFNHEKISYKFLPNEIYSTIKDCLGVEEEIKSIEEKLSRINVLNQEQYQKRVNRILFILTLLTLISVGYDAGQLATEQDPLKYGISIAIIALFLIVFLVLFNIKKNNRNS